MKLLCRGASCSRHRKPHVVAALTAFNQHLTQPAVVMKHAGFDNLRWLLSGRSDKPDMATSNTRNLNQSLSDRSTPRTNLDRQLVTIVKVAGWPENGHGGRLIQIRV